MKGKDIEAEMPEKTQEEIAKSVILDIKKLIISRKERLAEAEAKLAEFLEKDINDIKEKGANHWDWE